MKHTITHGPSYALLKLQLDEGESVTAEAGAMVTMSPTVEMKTRLNAGTKAGFFRRILAFFAAFFRKIFGGETMFVNEFSAAGGPGEVTLAPGLSGEIVHRRMEGARLMVQSGSFLAMSPGVDMKLKWGGLRSMFGKEGIAWLDVSGTGDLFINSYGGVEEIPVNGEFIVDNGHIVAFDASLDFKIKSAGGGFKGLFASGEGLVCQFHGTGSVYVQSRNLGSLIGWLIRLLPGT